MTDSTVNVLTHLRSRTQIDLDSFGLAAARDGGPEGPWTDATSNPAEVYFQLAKEENTDIIAQTITICRDIQGRYAGVTLPELRVEVATVLLALRVIPYITGAVHVMVNPCHAFSTTKVIQTGLRYHDIFQHIDPRVDLSRVVIKAPATFEGLKACHALRTQEIQTLATTVFTIEQAILAGEAGCVSISPFVHELKAGFDPTYKDHGPLLDLCVQAQEYYRQHSNATRVKACSCLSVEEILQLSGVAAHTIPPEDLDTLAAMNETVAWLESRSLFPIAASTKELQQQVRRSYIEDEAGYRVHFAASDGGGGQRRLYQALAIFADFQHKVELLVGESKGRL
ncbi:transaldolase [Aspergillus saccharolyticus JOP 1030-1]|uniref:Transaldolase n=1 Tax=Aspergillus saccharolyticus JOP 1030-1 TaxID=1450539 RepID=A0A318Z577_9EURO|nr:transaldolase [Aspergillus saccharolyticus JOP 1030-1]PYH42256.1 transaldolase [Aspergillus saccharolyticus JOP 1030-1]